MLIRKLGSNSSLALADMVLHLTPSRAPTSQPIVGSGILIHHRILHPTLAWVLLPTPLQDPASHPTISM